MIRFEKEFRVGYAETDKMGYLHHRHYVRFFEETRLEMFRSIGLVYKEIEDRGFILPVRRIDISYFKSACYDDFITIRAELKEMPCIRFHVFYEVFNAKKELMTEGFIELVLADMKTGLPKRMPNWMNKKLSPFFNKETQ